MFQRLKLYGRAVAAGTKAAANCAEIRLLALEAKNLWNDACREANASAEKETTSFWGKGLKNELFWEDVFKRFQTKYRKSHPSPEAPELESRCEAMLGIIQESSLTMAIRVGMYKDPQVQSIGEFFAITTACGIDNALLLDAERAALVYEFIPPEWLAAANLDQPVFSQWYNEQTRKTYKPLR